MDNEIKKSMEIEEIAKIDLFLKSMKGTDNILAIDSLIIIQNDPQCVNKLKEGAFTLTEMKNDASEEIKATWENLFSKQVRYSVNRAKNRKK